MVPSVRARQRDKRSLESFEKDQISNRKAIGAKLIELLIARQENAEDFRCAS